MSTISRNLKGSARGKYYKRAAAGSNLVSIDPELAALFPDSASVNRALRLLAGIARTALSPKRTPRGLKSTANK